LAADSVRQYHRTASRKILLRGAHGVRCGPNGPRRRDVGLLRLRWPHEKVHEKAGEAAKR
jgi:hypothetical protein